MPGCCTTGVRALGLTPYLEPRHQGPVIVTIHQPADPAFELQRFVDALKARGVLISNFHNTEAPTFRDRLHRRRHAGGHAGRGRGDRRRR